MRDRTCNGLLVGYRLNPLVWKHNQALLRVTSECAIIVMANRLIGYLVNYFLQLEKLEDKWTELLKCAKIPLNALETQSEQLRLVRSQEVDNAELCQVGNLRDRLVYQIRMGIENEIVLLQEIVTRMNTANQELGNKLTQLENARTKIPLSTPEIMYLVRGSPYLPRLDLLMEWALDGYLYYQDLYRGICMALKSIDSSDKRTVDTLSERFMEDKFRRARQDRILALTQFLSKERRGRGA